VARIGNATSPPLSLPAAKRAAIDVYRSPISGEPKNCIERPNRRVTDEIDEAYWAREKRKWPVDLIGGQRHRVKTTSLIIDPKLRQAIPETELVLKDDKLTRHALAGDDIKLEYHKDGYPKLPECLDRRLKPILAEAA
jgi:hypothetical protein